MDNAPDTLIVVDRGGKILYANHAFSKLADKPQNEIVGSRFDFFNLSEKYRDFIAESESGQRFNETIYTKKLGTSPKWINVSATSIKQNDETNVIIASLRDETKRKNLEEKLKSLAKKL